MSVIRGNPAGNNLQGEVEGAIYIQIRGVKQVCVSGGAQGGRLAGLIAPVAGLYLRQNLLLAADFSPLPQFQKTAARAGFGAGGYIKLYRCVGTDDGADIPPVQNRPIGPGSGGELPLKVQ